MKKSGHKKHSIRTRLTIYLLIPIVISLVLIGIASYYSAVEEGNEVYDAEMARLAVALHTLSVGDLDDERTVMISNKLDEVEYQKYISFRIWKNGRLLLQSENAQDFGQPSQQYGFSSKTINGKLWKFYTYPLHNVTVEIAENNAVRKDLIRHIMVSIFLPMLAIIPLMSLFLWLGIRKGLAPVDSLSQAVRNRDVNDLQPLHLEVTPKELSPVINEINNLILRVNDTIRIEKNFTNYAAHEMRTPIAALKTQAQVILRTNDTDRQKDLVNEMLFTVSRTQKLVEQLLVFARVQNTKIKKAPVDLTSTLLDVTRQLMPIAIEKNINLEHSIAQSLTIEGQADLLHILFFNILDNAIKYVPAGGNINLTANDMNDEVVISISDDGPGIPANVRDTIFDPFVRLDKSEIAGSGLGLSIVKWIAELSNARIVLSDGIGGKGINFTITLKNS